MRLPAYDYASAGAYFVTVVTANRACLFGDVVGEAVVLSDIGATVAETWRETAELRERVELDEFVVMPNHLHGILWLKEDADAPSGEGTPPRAPTARRFGASQPGALSTIINNFKGRVTTRARVQTGVSNLTIWQRSFHERIIRDERELLGIREYIVANPRLWEEDEEHP